MDTKPDFKPTRKTYPQINLMIWMNTSTFTNNFSLTCLGKDELENEVKSPYCFIFVRYFNCSKGSHSFIYQTKKKPTKEIKRNIIYMKSLFTFYGN